MDAVRGLALCGILCVNIVGITGMSVSGWAYETVLHQRFFPVFAFLFGLSAALFLRAAGERVAFPRLILLARLGFLLPVGVLHQGLQPGEVLLPYAVAGIVFLVPASFLPRGVMLGLGGVALVAALAVGGGTALIPGLFLLGLAAGGFLQGADAGKCGVQEWPALPVVLGLGAAAVVLDVWQAARPDAAPLSALAGVVTGAAYSVMLLALLRTRARPALLAVLEPLGRTALTNYLSATVLIVAADRALALGTAGFGRAAGLAAVILAVQAGFARWWLRRFRYGPAEWVWRSLTWWRTVPLRVPERVS